MQYISITVNNAKIELTGNNTRNIKPKEQCENKTYREQKNKYKSQETDKEITRSTHHKEQGIMQKIPVTKNNRRNNNQTTQYNTTTNREQLKKN
jgi:hypothetical protein